MTPLGKRGRGEKGRIMNWTQIRPKEESLCTGSNGNTFREPDRSSFSPPMNRDLTKLISVIDFLLSDGANLNCVHGCKSSNQMPFKGLRTGGPPPPPTPGYLSPQEAWVSITDPRSQELEEPPRPHKAAGMGEKLAFSFLPTPALREALPTQPAELATPCHTSGERQRHGSVTQVSEEKK